MDNNNNVLTKVLSALMKADKTNRADGDDLKEVLDSNMTEKNDDILSPFSEGADIITALYYDESAGYDAIGILVSAIPILAESLIDDDNDCGKFDRDYIIYIVLKYIHNIVPELNEIYKSQYFYMEWDGSRSNRLLVTDDEHPVYDDGYSCKNCIASWCETCRFLVKYKIISSGGSVSIESSDKIPLTDPIVVFLMKKEVEVGRGLPLKLPEGQIKRFYNRVKELEDRYRKTELQCILDNM